MNMDNIDKFADAVMFAIDKYGWQFMAYGIEHAEELQDEEDARKVFNVEFDDIKYDIIDDLYKMSRLDESELNKYDINEALSIIKKHTCHFMAYGIEHAEELQDDDVYARDRFNANYEDFEDYIVEDFRDRFEVE